MLRKLCLDLRTTTLLPLCAGVICLAAVGPAGAIHPPIPHGPVHKPQIRKDGLDFVGLTVTTQVDQNGSFTGAVVVESVVPGSLADASKLEKDDVIVFVNGAAAGTSSDFDTTVTNAAFPPLGQLPLPFLTLGVIDNRDRNAGLQPLKLFLQ